MEIINQMFNKHHKIKINKINKIMISIIINSTQTIIIINLIIKLIILIILIIIINKIISKIINKIINITFNILIEIKNLLIIIMVTIHMMVVWDQLYKYLIIKIDKII